MIDKTLKSHMTIFLDILEDLDNKLLREGVFFKQRMKIKKNLKKYIVGELLIAELITNKAAKELLTKIDSLRH